MTPSHNPPSDGGFKYNPPHGGPADSDATKTIAARANAAADGREADFDAALEAFTEEWDVGDADGARFEKEYLLAVGTRR